MIYASILALIGAIVGTTVYGALMWRDRSLGAWRWALLGGIIFAGSFLVTPLLWCVSLVPPLNTSNSPVILGIGGAPYGLAYEYYASAIMYWVGLSSAAFVATMLFRRRPRSAAAFGAMGWTHLTRLRSLVNWGVFAASLLSIVLFCLLFSLHGWDRLWSSPLGRFEVNSGGAIVFDARVHQVSFLMLGLLCSLGLALPGVRRWGGVGFVVCSLAFVTFASRGATVLAFIAGIAFLGSLPSRRRGVALIIFIPVMFIAYILPLNMRHKPGTGLVFAGAALREIVSLEYRSGGDSVVQFAQNASLGFPIFVQAMELSKGGGSPMKNVPTGYQVLSFSPFPSFIDGYARDYHQYRLMLNPVTPYNLVSECYFIHPVLPFVVIVIAVLLAFGLLTWVWRVVPGGVVVVYLFAPFWTLFALYSQQYLTRASLKMWYYGLFGLVCVAWAVYWLEARRLVAGRQLSHSALNT